MAPEEEEEGGGGEESGGASLFDGMILFSPSDLSPSPDSLPVPVVTEPQIPPPPPPLPSLSQPLDEDLFSELTLQTEPQIETPDSLPPPSPAAAPEPQPPSRQISRKKKRAVRIGYGRDSSTADEPPPPDSLPNPPPPPLSPPPIQEPTSPETTPNSSQHLPPPLDVAASASDSQEDSKIPSSPQILEQEKDPLRLEQEKEQEDATPSQEEEEEEEDVLGLIEEKLRLIRARISAELDRIRETAAQLSAERKEVGRRRRKAMENVNSASDRFKELEKELEEACEAEDFERAERVSESLATAEKEKDGFLSELRNAELECDSVDSKMQELLQLQIAAEEDGMSLLQQFAKDAAGYADSVLKHAAEVSSKKIEAWQSSMELLEINKIEMDIESHLISEARSGLENSIEYLVEDDNKEVEKLRSKRSILTKELDELLALVRLKEAEIAENDCQIQEVEKKISEVTSGFHKTQLSIDMKHDNLQLALSKVESEGEALSITKKEIDEFILLAEQKSSKLKELASVSSDEARTCQDLVELRKSLASSILKSREDKVKLAKMEETILEEIQILRQQINAARTTLQELSSTRASIQQEIAAFKQRIGFVDKRGPELEAEKKVAAAARNFKEAGRIAAEAKALNAEKESLQDKRDKAVLDLEKIEEEINDTIERMQEQEGLILLREKEAATASCKRLRLVAAASRAERSASLEMGDLEGETLLKEAEAADSKAKELEEAYGLEQEEHGKILEHFVSIALVTNLTDQHLAEMASSFNVSATSGS